MQKKNGVPCKIQLECLADSLDGQCDFKKSYGS